MIAPPIASPKRSCRFYPTRRHGGVRSRLLLALTTSWGCQRCRAPKPPRLFLTPRERAAARTYLPTPRQVNRLFVAARYHHTAILPSRATRDRIILTVHGRMTKKSKKHKSA